MAIFHIASLIFTKECDFGASNKSSGEITNFTDGGQNDPSRD
jgi:hypothetical protein